MNNYSDIHKYYEILNIHSNASIDEIKKAYRKLSLENHPDRNHNNHLKTEKMKKITEAYEILSNSLKSQSFNNLKNTKIPFTNNNNLSSDDTETIANDLVQANSFFNMLFQGGLNEQPLQYFTKSFKQMQKPKAIYKTLEITLEQAYFGCSLPIEIEKLIQENNIQKYETETLYVSIPIGIDNNEIITLKEMGNIESEWNKGDVKIIIKIISNNLFERKGLDLIYNKTITFKESLCGFSFNIIHLNNKTYQINNNDGTIILDKVNKIIPKLGMIRNSHIGNLIIIFNISYPEKLSKEKINNLKEIL